MIKGTKEVFEFGGLRKLVSLFCLLMATPFLLSCGFHAVYGSHGNGKPEVSAALNDVVIDNLADRHGQILRNDLIDLMYVSGRPQSPKYRLAATLKPTEESLGILQDAVTTLTELTMNVDFQLIDLSSGKVLVTGTAHSISSFSQITQQYATLAGEDDAYQRTLNEVAQQIVTRLGLYFSEGPLITTPTAPANNAPNLMPGSGATSTSSMLRP